MKKKNNKWYLAKDEPVKSGGFRKNAKIGGREDLDGLLKDESLAVGTVLVHNNTFYVVENIENSNGHKKSRIDVINAYLGDLHSPILIKMKNSTTTLIINNKPYIVKTNSLITKLQLLMELTNNE